MILTCINTSYINTAGHFQPLLSFTIFTCPSISFQPFFSCIFIYTFLSPYSIFLRIRHKSQIISAIIVMCVCVCVYYSYTKSRQNILGQAQKGVGTENRWMDILQNRMKHFRKSRELSLNKIPIIFCMSWKYAFALMYILILKIFF